MFFFGEDSVTDNLSPYIDAAPREEQKYFLATQQVDEARHSVFFHRFFKEVIGAGDSIASTLAYTEPQLGWGYRNVFDRLDRMADELRRDRSLPKFARAIALYHMVVEATLAQPGQHFIEDFFTKAGTMPGFSEGMHNVSRDEQRHIGFGVKVLSECFAESEECKAAVVELLREVMPLLDGGLRRHRTGTSTTRAATASSSRTSTPSGCDRCGPSGTPPATRSRRCRRRLPFDLALPHEETRTGQITLLRAGVLGEPTADPDSSPEVQRLLLRHHRPLGAHRGAQRRPDDDPVALRRRRRPGTCGSTTARPPPSLACSSAPDLTLETSWNDWIEVSTGGESARRAILERKIRPHGSLRNLMRLGRLFPGRPSRLA